MYRTTGTSLETRSTIRISQMLLSTFDMIMAAKYDWTFFMVNTISITKS